MQLFDTVSTDTASVRRTGDGYLVADTRVARTGIQLYAGHEVGQPDKQVVRVYRPESEVFAADAMRSYAYRPVTNDHPSESVTADNWKQYSAGQTGDEVTRDGSFVRVPLVLMDKAAIDDFEGGKRELSMGYTSELTFEDGTTPDGEPYDAVQTQLRMNHLALVDRARGGEQLRIGDRHTPNAADHVPNHPNQEGRTMAETRKVVIDGLTIDTTDQGAQAIEKLQKQLTDAESARSDLKINHDAAIAVKDTELAKKDAEIDDLNKQVMSDEDLDKAVNERADLIGKAKVIADADYTGKSPAEIRKAAVVAKFGDAAIEGKSDAYVEARFDVLTEQADADPVRTALNTRDTTSVQDNGQAAYEQRLTNAWKGITQEAH